MVLQCFFKVISIIQMTLTLIGVKLLPILLPEVEEHNLSLKRVRVRISPLCLHGLNKVACSQKHRIFQISLK